MDRALAFLQVIHFLSEWPECTQVQARSVLGQLPVHLRHQKWETQYNCFEMMSMSSDNFNK